ncbi:MAG: ROK family transcriptional regulator [Planctomycetota bacterium]|jgi:predicted NBD/HSP70 family sugar kinase|nr:ROK family transcriptional regulator [Planctomycetota bacterium]
MAAADSLRTFNQRAVLAALRAGGMASRAELAEAVGISKPTAGKIVDELLAAGVVQEQESAAAGPGRPSRPVAYDADVARFLLIELNQNRTRLALVPVAVPADDEAVWSISFATPDTASAWAAALHKAVGAPAGLWAAVASVPGVVDDEQGRCLFCHQVPWAPGEDLRALISAAVGGVPTVVLQEIRTLALGHAVAGSGDDFLLVDSGDGLGSAAMIGGHLHRAAGPFSGELGHTPVLGRRRRCGCGATGCLETLLAAPRLQRCDDKDLDAAGAIVGAALNTLGLARVVLTGALAELAPARLQRLRAAITGSALAARLGSIAIDTAPRRRALGLHQAVHTALLDRTDNWRYPCRVTAA